MIGVAETGWLLEKVIAHIRRFVVMSHDQALAVGLWVLLTWAVEAFDCSPYLDVSSPSRECGKTRLFEALQLLVRRPRKCTGHTEATLFRMIESEHPTLLMDEIDTTFGKDPKLYAGIRGVLDEGHRRGGSVPRMVGEGKKMTIKYFDVFGPKKRDRPEKQKAESTPDPAPSHLADAGLRGIPATLRRGPASWVVDGARTVASPSPARVAAGLTRAAPGGPSTRRTTPTEPPSTRAVGGRRRERGTSPPIRPARCADARRRSLITASHAPRAAPSGSEQPAVDVRAASPNGRRCRSPTVGRNGQRSSGRIWEKGE